MSENLNICLVNDSFPPEIDGVANAVKNYADIISKKHGKVTVVTPNNPEADDRTFRFPVLRYPSVDLTKLVGYYAGFPFSPEVQRKLVAEKFDLIHSHCYQVRYRHRQCHLREAFAGGGQKNPRPEHRRLR